jgi:hypothetical protein
VDHRGGSVAGWFNRAEFGVVGHGRESGGGEAEGMEDLNLTCATGTADDQIVRLIES